jgi:hypothetical protein
VEVGVNAVVEEFVVEDGTGIGVCVKVLVGISVAEGVTVTTMFS